MKTLDNHHDRVETADVLAEPLLWEDGRLRLGEPALRRVRWRDDGRSFVHPQPQELVSLHWDFVCDVLTPQTAARLAAITRRVLAAVNADAPAVSPVTPG